MGLTGAFGFNPKRTWTSSAATGYGAKLGDRGSDKTGEYIFVQADGAITQYDAVMIDPLTYKAKSITTTTAGSGAYASVGAQAGFAQVAAADTEQLWVWIGRGGGTGFGVKGRVAASYVANAKLYTTGTAGVLDDTATTAILGVIGLTTDSGSGSAVELYAAGYIGLAQ
jgi:hypothetical protein